MDEQTERHLSLWSAVLHLGVEDALKERLFNRVGPGRIWVASKDIYPGSFEWCCTLLDIDSDAVRKAIAESKNFSVRRCHVGY